MFRGNRGNSSNTTKDHDQAKSRLEMALGANIGIKHEKGIDEQKGN
jgi:hypothetical protein